MICWKKNICIKQGHLIELEVTIFLCRKIFVQLLIKSIFPGKKNPLKWIVAYTKTISQFLYKIKDEVVIK